MPKKVIVIGGGMAGTSAAHTLTKLGYDVTIVEKESRIGGRMKSHMVDGIALEQGAGFVMAIYANVLGFLKQQGLYTDLFRAHHAHSGIVRDGAARLVGLRTVLGGSLLSWKAKLTGVNFLLKVLRNWRSIDIHRPWKLVAFDRASVGTFQKTSGGTELFDYFLQPALTGTWYWTPEDVAHTSEGILYIAAKAILRGPTYHLRTGLQRIPEKAAEGSQVLLEHKVTRVERQSDGSYTITMVHNGKEQVLRADGIVCATTATVAARLFPNLSTTRRAFIESIRYSSVSYLGLIHRSADLRGTNSIAIPSNEGRLVTGITSMSGPVTGWVKISAAGTSLRGKDDITVAGALIEGSRAARDAVFAHDTPPLSSIVWQWDEALPTVETGYFQKLKHFVEEEEVGHEPLMFAGDYIGGAFIEGAFTSGMQAAERLHAVLSRP